MHLSTPDLVQVAIAVIGVLAAWINQDPTERTRRWACVIGLTGQPFWAYSAWQASQWGVLAVTAGYTVAFLRGISLYWLTPSPSASATEQDHTPTVPYVKYFPD